MAGKKENLAPMWKAMMKFIELEPAKAMTVSQYLGCAQKEIQPEVEDIERMSAAFENCSVKRGDCPAHVAHPELRKSQGDVYIRRIKSQTKLIQRILSWIKDPKVRVILHSAKVKLHAEIKRSYGMFLNMQIVRVDLHTDATYEAMHMICRATLRQAWKGILSWQVNQSAQCNP